MGNTEFSGSPRKVANAKLTIAMQKLDAFESQFDKTTVPHNSAHNNLFMIGPLP
jgi:hypothetical protein